MLGLFQAIGVWEILIVVGVIVLIFGAAKLPDLGRALGRSLREFKKGISGEDEKEELQPGKGEEKKE